MKGDVFLKTWDKVIIRRKTGTICKMEGMLSFFFFFWTLPLPFSCLGRAPLVLVVKDLWTAEKYNHLPKTKTVEIHQGSRLRAAAG